MFPGAVIDVWHCDAAGVYSDVTDPGFDTTGSDFLRGYQVTDESGRAAFTTVYPGWYQGRTVHIHFKIRTDPDQDAGSSSRRSCSSTTRSPTRCSSRSRTPAGASERSATTATASTRKAAISCSLW